MNELERVSKRGLLMRLSTTSLNGGLGKKSREFANGGGDDEEDDKESRVRLK